MQNLSVYFFCALSAFLITSVSVPLIVTLLDGKFTDIPSGLKTHSGAVPLAGGPALMAGIFLSLLIVRLTIPFPTGTLHSLRGVLAGGLIIFAAGLVDDIKKPAGISALTKFAAQTAAAAALIFYGVKINFVGSNILSYILTVLWVIGLTNAFNLLDIVDLLAVSQACCAALFFIIIALPSEQIYVNFTACALLGAGIGFAPYNVSKRCKSFMGDSGSMLLGFTLAAASMGAQYSFKNPAAVLAPLLILAVPLWDTAFVFTARIMQRKNPFKGSPDHAVIRLQKYGLSSNSVVIVFLAASIIYGALALLLIHLNPFWTSVILTLTILDALACGVYIYKLKT
ncbi:MAG: undecaprenyl/decaprenyl-phosphate alpha-N-acetylglucosaminyl 1-phosphate transferase [Elusimicrobium sp.]|jgi:UDP-GlcNAc:undecaprenyl-phosphate GlcNAc-1-phosphate transferase|nr:undecaprenyl/decaprenyl-phosphate alpha-N-acetylglucosaminyl 1-phosphate transferase [Elusimicrobium sp.]